MLSLLGSLVGVRSMINMTRLNLCSILSCRLLKDYCYVQENRFSKLISTLNAKLICYISHESISILIGVHSTLPSRGVFGHLTCLVPRPSRQHPQLERQLSTRATDFFAIFLFSSKWSKISPIFFL